LNRENKILKESIEKVEAYNQKLNNKLYSNPQLGQGIVLTGGSYVDLGGALTVTVLDIDSKPNSKIVYSKEKMKFINNKSYERIARLRTSIIGKKYIDMSSGGQIIFKYQEKQFRLRLLNILPNKLGVQFGLWQTEVVDNPVTVKEKAFTSKQSSDIKAKVEEYLIQNERVYNLVIDYNKSVKTPAMVGAIPNIFTSNGIMIWIKPEYLQVEQSSPKTLKIIFEDIINASSEDDPLMVTENNESLRYLLKYLHEKPHYNIASDNLLSEFLVDSEKKLTYFQLLNLSKNIVAENCIAIDDNLSIKGIYIKRVSDKEVFYKINHMAINQYHSISDLNR
jgi:hypothetical protein